MVASLSQSEAVPFLNGDIMLRNKGFCTQSVHAGERGPRPDYTPTSTPIYHSVGYLYDDMADLDAVFAGGKDGYVYPRYGNPTVAAFERALAILEDTEDAVAYASGMAAIHAALLGAGARQGAHVVAATDVYGATYALLTRTLCELGVHTRFVDFCDLAAVAQAVEQERPAALICEIISNPLMKVADVPRLVEIAHQAGAVLIVDNTFASPYLYRPAKRRHRLCRALGDQVPGRPRRRAGRCRVLQLGARA